MSATPEGRSVWWDNLGKLVGQLFEDSFERMGSSRVGGALEGLNPGPCTEEAADDDAEMAADDPARKAAETAAN